MKIQLPVFKENLYPILENYKNAVDLTMDLKKALEVSLTIEHKGYVYVPRFTHQGVNDMAHCLINNNDFKLEDLRGEFKYFKHVLGDYATIEEHITSNKILTKEVLGELE